MKDILKKISRFTTYTILGLVVIVSAYMTIQKSIAESKLKSVTDIHSEKGIQVLESWTIGGVKQWVSVRGQDKNNPVILMIHGGPGSTDMSFARFIDTQIEKEFTVIRWDQRGAGKSYSPLESLDNLKVEQFHSDVLEVVLEIKKRLGKEKIYIAGHSWGSFLGATFANRHPEHLYAYIGIGQIVNWKENEKVSYRFTLEEAKKENNQIALEELTRIGEPPYNLEAIGIQRSWLLYYGGGMFHGEHRKDAFSHMGDMMFASPEYSNLDTIKFFLGMFSTLYSVMGSSSMDEIDLTPLKEYKVPVFFMLGRYDYNTPFELSVSYMDKINAPSKKIYWFEKSAHAPNMEEPEEMAKALYEIKKATCKE